MQTRILDDGPVGSDVDAAVVSCYFSAITKRWETDPLFRAFVQQTYGNTTEAMGCVDEISHEAHELEHAFQEFVTYDDLALLAEQDSRDHSLKRSIENVLKDDEDERMNFQ